MLALVLFLNGMAVMVLEMAGARLLAPWLGTSVVVWTSLIGIILASLSVGYWLGGKLADKVLAQDNANAKHGPAKGNPPKAARVLSALFTGAAALVLVSTFIYKPVLAWLSGSAASLYFSTVAAALILFAFPAVVCGMISPYATRLAITNSATAGSIIGRLNAVSTVGSIIGTFLGGFVLISWFGTVEIMFGVAICLLVAAGLTGLRPLLGKVLVVSLLAFSMLAHGLLADSFSTTGIEIRETLYNTIQIRKSRYNNRLLIALSTDPGKVQSGAYEDDLYELAFPYTRYYNLGTALNPGARRILMLGGGGYSVPKWLLAGRSGLDARDFQLDVVEIDPGITKAAVDYLGLPANDSRMRIFHEDARTFARRAATEGREKYDLIFMDVFNSYYSVPFHIGTLEAAREINALLADDGIFLMNIISSLEGENGRLFQAVHAAFAEVFPEIAVFPVHKPTDAAGVQNIILMAAKGPEYEESMRKAYFSAEVRQMLASRWTKEFSGVIPPLTDNFAPVERYTLGFLR